MGEKLLREKLSEMQNAHQTRQGKAPEKKHEAPEHDESNWLISYADMMTLLCIFFVMLFSMSSLKKPEFEKVRKEVARHFGGKYESQSDGIEKILSQSLREAGVREGVRIFTDTWGIAVVLDSRVFFDSMMTTTNERGRRILKQISGALAIAQKEQNTLYRFVIEGHTDAKPLTTGIYASNWELSGARAYHVKDLLAAEGFEPPRLLAIGYADSKPALPHRNPSGELDEGASLQNRRVIIRVLEPEYETPFFD